MAEFLVVEQMLLNLIIVETRPAVTQLWNIVQNIAAATLMLKKREKKNNASSSHVVPPHAALGYYSRLVTVLLTEKL